MAGIGEKPKTRSGPHFCAVCRHAAATISSTSSHVVRRKPPLPRASWTAGALLRVVLRSTPRPRSGRARAGLAPEVREHAADVRVLDPDRAVDVPGGRDAALAAARLVRRQARLEQRVVERLHLPRDDPVLDVDHPGAAARAVDAVGRADRVVVLPAVPIELLPLAGLRLDEVLDPAHYGLTSVSSG